ncbi:ankyrin repeat domain-containing protein [Arcobacter sp. L]|uniref:ankyrin repeat domain-containing protein n=1 Tax=Arcobacter sp. L TaxID=944547 RepID=UPI0002295E30|nr:ankyrin repeat domain-containing protein [Arcobacter sp. L]BAK72205.1 ankyrin repeat-containing protein [Arcobacter sp. L]
MFSKLLKKTKFTEEEFIKELISSSLDLEKITKIYNQLDIDLNSYYYKDEHILHYCCKKDLYESVLWLLNQGVSPEIENNQKETAIFYAIHSKSSAIMQLLIEHNANINHLNIYRRTALQDAVISASNRIVNFLIDVTTNLGNCDIHGNNLIFDAIANGNLEIIKKVASLQEININQINEEGNTILQKEIVLKNNNLALLLLDLGANPTILDKNGKNFLFYAITKGIENISIIQKAVELGCNINSKSSQNTTLLMESINYFLNAKDENEKISHFEMIKELINLGVNVETLDNKGENAFFLATKSEDRELINLFLENSNVNLNHENIDGETVLSILVLNGIRNSDLIKLYLEKGANPTLENKFGKSIIEILIDIILHVQNRKELDFEYEILLNEDAEYPTVLENLLRNCKIDLNKLNSKGEPIFFQSILYFNFKLFKILRIKNINLNQKDKDGNNIVFKLMQYNYQGKIKDKKLYLNTLKSLINSGVDINAKNNEGLTALHVAVTEKCEYTIRLLLELRADCFITDSKGRSIINNCILKNTTKYFKLIHHYNKDIVDIPDIFGVKPINYAAFMGKKDLVIEMLDEGVSVNNPSKKDPKILKFLEKFHQNIIDLSKGVEKELDKANLNLLANNMIKEFNITQ